MLQLLWQNLRLMRIVGHWVTSLKGEANSVRANDAWDVSWGGKAAFSGGTGDNIPVTKSKYKIYFNDLDGSYLMIPNQP
jgi:hypothetical protein